MRFLPKFGIGIFVLGILLADLKGYAAEQEEVRTFQPTKNYCGIYAVYAAAIRAGVPFDFKSLLDRKYMKCPKGSSMAELQRAAVDHGLQCVAIREMVPHMLQESKNPVILYVRSDVSSPNYDHYIVYLHFVDGAYVCLDEDRLRHLSESELLTVWSGSGLIVSKSDIKVAGLITDGWLSSSLWLVSPLALVLIAKRIFRRFDGRSRWAFRLRTSAATQLLFIVTSAAVVAVAYHRISVAGFLAPESQVKAVQDGHIGDFIPKLSEAAAYRLFNLSEAQFVDARYSDDFTAGHIKDAINLPIDSNKASQLMIMKSVLFDRPIVVYCQSKGCPFAEAVASRLIRDGYTNVSVYVEGWQGWRENTDKM